MFNKVKEYYEAKKEYRKETYKKLLKIVLRNIELLAYEEKTKYLYEIPEHVLGEPSYEVKEAASYLERWLKEYKFKDVTFYEPNVLYIEWEIK
jgi:hypothetical protein